jgi:Tfp pilus assembly protein PilO
MSATRWVGHAGLGAAVFAAIVVSWSLTVHAWSVAQRERLVRDVTALEARLRTLEVAAAKVREFDAEVARVEAERAALERALPAVADTRALAASLDSSARELGLVVGSLRWGEAEKREPLATVPLTLEVRGAPAAALAFAVRVAAGEPLVALRSVDLTRGAPSVLRIEAEALAVPEGR